MDIDQVIRELRVDWEDLISNDFNPIKYIKSLEKEDSVEANDFRNIFYKVEKVMEKIIEENYQVFNDSMLLFSTFYESNKKNLLNLENEIKFCDDILKIDTKNTLEIDEIKDLLWFDEYKNVIAGYKELIASIDEAVMNENYVHSSNLLVDAFKLFEKYNLGTVKIIHFKKIKSKRSQVLTFLFKEIETFLVGNIADYKEQCIGLINLGGLKFLDKCLVKNVNKILIQEVNRIIDSNKGKEQVQIKRIIDFYLQFYHRLSALISFALRFDTEKLDLSFFETEIESDNKLIKQEYRDILSQMFFDNITLMIQVFCFNQVERDNQLSFDVNDIVDRVNYEEYFVKESFIPKIESLKNFSLQVYASLEHLFVFEECIEKIDSNKIKEYILDQINTKYFKNKNHKIQRKLIFILSDKKEFRIDYFTGYSKFLGKINFDEIFYMRKPSDKKFLIFIFEIIIRKITIYFYDIFKGRVSLYEGDIKEKIIKQEFENIMFLDRNTVQEVSCVIRTLRKLEQINNEKISEYVSETTVEETNINFSHQSEDNSLKISTIDSNFNFEELIDLFTKTLVNEYTLEFMFYFNMFYRNRNKFIYFISKLEALFGKYRQDVNVNDIIFEVLNYYIKKMLKILDVNTFEELKCFINQLILLDDVLSELKAKANDSLYFSIDFFYSLLDRKTEVKEENQFIKRLTQ
ncbi:hypothetical protein H312_03287 [Anncaliia algerae PRA339]|uniref:Exocyst complex component Sec8 N-terminal domain-containing protein n=1 Tax=Anncaliia algerae PRA339 TaxID=1288291 RepID=A0A059EX35_9MICR|nr:hypothetical protein H312_03287 [Anncaliia algerae PRA339]